MGYGWDLGGAGVWGGMRIWGDMGTLGYVDIWGCSLQECSAGQKVMCGAGMRGGHGCRGAMCGYGTELGVWGRVELCGVMGSQPAGVQC